MGTTQSWQGQRDRLTSRSVVLASADLALRQRLKSELAGMRWTVAEAGGGAEAMARVEESRPEALVVDSWLPDLEVVEFAAQMGQMYPGLDVLHVDGAANGRGLNSARSPRRNELLHAIREAQEVAAPAAVPMSMQVTAREEEAAPAPFAEPVELLPGLVGGCQAMRELARLVRLVAPRRTSVLLEGETGTGKEVVAQAIHRHSPRASKPLVTLNCAAIPESLLEAELFGHSRGAFTGAVQSRTGRIEAAHGGTLFLDEIGEMPLGLQAKLLRFLENGELQRVGENEVVRVDVRVVAATHQLLEERAAEKTFRLDLYHRLAVFPVALPALRERTGDLPLLVEFFLEQMGRESPRKTISVAALEQLTRYTWPGNVRELMHVLERGSILAEDRAVIGEAEILLHTRRRD